MLTNIRKRNNHLDESAQEMAWLVESRSVGIYPWKKDVDSLWRYIRRRVREQLIYTEPYADIHFVIEDDELPYISFIDDLTIEVNASFHKSMRETGSGSISPCKASKPVISQNSNKIQNIKITVWCFYDEKGEVIASTLVPSMYHEFNHIYHLYALYDKFGTTEKFTQYADRGLTDKLHVEPVIKQLIYRLYSETEFNAFAVNLYGELKSLNVKRSEFSSMFHKTETYREYREIYTSYIGEIGEMSNEECREVLSFFEQHNISLYRNPKTIDDFKMLFTKKTQQLLRRLMKKFGQAASLWFDEHEADEQINNNGYIKTIK